MLQLWWNLQVKWGIGRHGSEKAGGEETARGGADAAVGVFSARACCCVWYGRSSAGAPVVHQGTANGEWCPIASPGSGMPARVMKMVLLRGCIRGKWRLGGERGARRRGCLNAEGMLVWLRVLVVPGEQSPCF